jgi:hypothetical protein
MVEQVYRPRCHGLMKTIAIIEDPDVIFKILNHLGILGQDPPAESVRAPPGDLRA